MGGGILKFDFINNIKKYFILGSNSSYFNSSVLKRLQNSGQAVFDYNFLMSLNEKKYKKYLSQAYFIKTEQVLHLNRPKTFSEKIQWLKLYDNIPLKTQLTDKVLAKDWVKSKIGEQFIKPTLWVGKNFDLIPFDSLPNTFIIKANHGCKWHFIVKDKQKFIENSRLFTISKITMDGWMEQSFFGWSDFETQYKNIDPKIIIEELYREDINVSPLEFEVWCFNGTPKIIQQISKEIKKSRIVNTFDENFRNIDLKFLQDDIIENSIPDVNLKKAVDLSKILAENFKFVRVDWMLYKNHLYFEEMTFTPLSGYFSFPDEYKHWQSTLGNMLNLKGG